MLVVFATEPVTEPAKLGKPHPVVWTSVTTTCVRVVLILTDRGCLDFL